jgi:hypothetical protein
LIEPNALRLMVPNTNYVKRMPRAPYAQQVFEITIIPICVIVWCSLQTQVDVWVHPLSHHVFGQ